MNENATSPAQIKPARAVPPQATLQYASLRRRMVSMFYESLLLVALLMVAAFAYLPLLGIPHSPFQKAVFQLYLIGVLLAYFVIFWKRGGQTLAMKTWHIRLVTANGGSLPAPLCILRFTLALAGSLCGGLGFVWALFDRDRQFLHDRIAGTRLVQAD